jgi:hypothetical protein
MTTTADIFDLVYAALAPAPGAPAPTDAGERVHRPGMLPTQSDDYPQIKTRVVSESRQSLGRGAVEFTTTATIRAIGEVSAPVMLVDVQKSDVEVKLWALKRQIEMAVIGSYPLFRVVQQLASVQAQLNFDVQNTMLAGIQIDLAFEFYEGPEDFAPPAADEIDGFDCHTPAGPGFSTSLQ